MLPSPHLEVITFNRSHNSFSETILPWMSRDLAAFAAFDLPVLGGRNPSSDFYLPAPPASVLSRAAGVWLVLL